ncbi:hypothetical protein, partial [Klebsiella oxytoca]|uniref:hypothetical protein n=1 Tax=Klebsiella oxytoca TaxID=571 RepID=UPI0013E3205C
IHARAASVTATSSLTVAAGNDINLSSGESSWHLTENNHQSSSGLHHNTVTAKIAADGVLRPHFIVSGEPAVSQQAAAAL